MTASKELGRILEIFRTLEISNSNSNQSETKSPEHPYTFYTTLKHKLLWLSGSNLHDSRKV